MSIAVAASAVRRGVGTALIAGFEESIRSICGAYRLHVLKDNTAALRFYERLGFERVGKRDASWVLRRIWKRASKDRGGRHVVA